jgi:hypothetical protein
MNIHFPSAEGLDKPPVLALSLLVVCLHCGFTEFTMLDDALPRLRNSDHADGDGESGGVSTC